MSQVNDTSSAVILARVSSKAQEDEGYSLDSQFKLLQGYCEQNQLRVVKVFKIAETASKEQGRKIFHEMIDYLEKNNIYHLTVEKTDRLTRNFKDAVAINDWFDADPDRKLHAVKESLILHKEAKSDVKFMWNIHLSVAKKFTDNLREEAMKGWAEKLAQGWLPAPPPPGYKTITQNGKRIHVPDPETFTLMKKVFERYLEPDSSVNSISKEMDLMGIRTRRGHPYVKSAVHRILSNPFYIGINRMNGRDYPGAQQPLLTKSTYDRVQSKLTRRTSKRFRKHNPVFKSMITCTTCGGLITWQLQKGRYYGACQRKMRECTNRRLLREDKLEMLVCKKLYDLVSPSEEVIEWAIQAIEQRHAQKTQDNEKIRSSIQQQINRLETMNSNLYDDKIAGDISHETYESKNKEISENLKALQHKLGTQETVEDSFVAKRTALIKLTQEASKMYLKRNPDQKRVILTKLFEDMTSDGDTISVNYTKFANLIAQNVIKTKLILGVSK